MRRKTAHRLLFASLILASSASRGCSNSTPSTQSADYKLLIGSDGFDSLTGAAYICGKDLAECNILKFEPRDRSKGEIFGVSAYSNAEWLFIGWLWRSTSESRTGSVVRCLKNGTDCSEIDTARLGLKEKDSFGWSIGGDQEHVYIGARTRKSTGVVFKCNTFGEQCVEITPGDVGLTLGSDAMFGTSIHATTDNLFIGAIGVKGSESSTGAIFRCNKSLTKCSAASPPAGLQEMDRFGYAITSNENTIIVSAIGKSSMRGALYSCGISGEECHEIQLDGMNLSTGDAIGGALLMAPDRLYVSAVKRQEVRGSLFTCEKSGLNCRELKVPFELQPVAYFGSGLALAN